MATAGPYIDARKWVRPTDWPLLPYVSETAQVFYGLVAVTNTDGNYIAFSCTTSSGTYTVDWGDGTSDTYSSNAKASHQYTYSSLTSSVTSRGYKTAIVKITPTTANLTGINLQVRHPSIPSGTVINHNFLDISLGGPYLTSLSLGFNSPIANLYMVERVDIASHACTSLYALFGLMVRLQSVPRLPLAGVQITQNLWTSCYSMVDFPSQDLSSVTNASYMFYRASAVNDLGFLSNTQNITNTSNMFNSASNVEKIPALNFGSVTSGNYASLFAQCGNLASCGITGLKYTVSFANCKFSKTNLEAVFTSLAANVSGQTITVTGNPGVDTVVTKTATTTSGSKTYTLSDTSSLSVGMLVTGTGISTATNTTFQDSGDTVTQNSHGLANGKIVAFATITSTTGIATYTPYYVVNATTNTFQLSATAGGAALPLTTDGSGTMLVGAFIQSIVANTSVTIDVPASANGTVTLTHSLLDASIATLKGWTVSR